MEKQCFKCGQIKPLTEFYKHSQMGDGHLNKCKSCTRNDSKIQLNKNLASKEFHEKEKKRHREKYHKLNYKEKHKQSQEEKAKSMCLYKKKYPEKIKARNISQRLAKEGFHAHHWSYHKENALSIIYLTPKDHAKAHRFIIYDQERVMYRTLEGLLLDTKDAHENYILDKIQNG